MYTLDLKQREQDERRKEQKENLRGVGQVTRKRQKES
jgi:hypothetical protein